MAKCICVYSAILNKETCHSFEHKLVLNFYLAGSILQSVYNFEMFY